MFGLRHLSFKLKLYFPVFPVEFEFCGKSPLVFGLVKPLSLSVIPSVTRDFSSASFKTLPSNSENNLNWHDGHSSIFPVRTRMVWHRGQLSGASAVCTFVEVPDFEVATPG